jgi:hypothetical protein
MFVLQVSVFMVPTSGKTQFTDPDPSIALLKASSSQGNHPDEW